MKNEIAFPKNMNFTVGLTKREWFAGLAMQGFVANDNAGRGLDTKGADPMVVLAKASLLIADALIAELERKEE